MDTVRGVFISKCTWLDGEPWHILGEDGMYEFKQEPETGTSYTNESNEDELEFGDIISVPSSDARKLTIEEVREAIRSGLAAGA